MSAAPSRPRRQHARRRHRNAPRAVTVPPRVAAGGGAGRSLRRSVFGASLVTLFAIVPLLAAYGWQRALEAGGDTVLEGSTVTDPSAPGYEALVTPTHTLLLVQVTPEDTLAAVTLLASGDAGGGGVLLIPPRLVVDAGTPRPQPLATVYEASGADGVGDALRRSLRIGFGDVASVGDARWAALVDAVAPIPVDNTNELYRVGEDGEEELAFEAGAQELEADEVGEYLRLGVEGESAEAALYRHELFWQAWLARVAETGDAVAALPGETDSGLGLMVSELAAPAVDVRTLPVTPLDSVAEPGLVDQRADEDAQAQVLADLVPFPTSGIPGDRTRVRLLDGSGDREAALAAARALVPAGAEISIFGNADRFDHQRSEVRYHDAGDEAEAAALAAALGTDQVILEPREQEPVDVTIVIGLDVEVGASAGGTGDAEGRPR